jgi:redox-sensitive bicupin YhaK (pirin superfamily)
MSWQSARSRSRGRISLRRDRGDHCAADARSWKFLGSASAPFITAANGGAFHFFGSDGPTEFALGTGMDLRPHPHIGLSTVTYLFDGEIMHRDSLGTTLPIRPGEVNWMTAGSGIVHSERTAPELRSMQSSLFGIQSWVALQAVDEENLPGFVHYPASEIPVVFGEGKTVRVIAGSLLGARLPSRLRAPCTMQM